jgi:hypothetical protein
MGYKLLGWTANKLLGWTIWKGGKWYVRKRYGHLVPPRRLLVAGLTGALVAAIYAANRR